MWGLHGRVWWVSRVRGFWWVWRVSRVCRVFRICRVFRVWWVSRVCGFCSVLLQAGTATLAGGQRASDLCRGARGPDVVPGGLSTLQMCRAFLQLCVCGAVAAARRDRPPHGLQTSRHVGQGARPEGNGPGSPAWGLSHARGLTAVITSRYTQ
jgi:hypothetical protein